MNVKLEDSEALIQTITHLCEVMKPFNDFMNRALVDFKMPERPSKKGLS